ncbi:MAG: alpha/beta hydrolase [Acidobacteria bacterium]|nr:alpha/beta hydrolase [Acidobacteriota bacterium]
MATRLRRTLLTAAAIMMFLMLAGATYQGAATALERRQFPHPGELVDVGGHQLHIYCTGQGSPTVILEAPAAGMSSAWGWVQPDVARVARVCSYDRAGLGWSEAGDAPYDPAGVPDELHTLLQGAREQPPYVVAGQGLGAAFASLYAARFSADVVALVLIDPPAPDIEGAQPKPMLRLANASPWLARAGVLRATRLMSSNAAGLPEPAAGALGAFLNRPDHLARAAREMSRGDDAARLAADAVVDSHVRITRVEAADASRAAFLTGRREALAVSAALISAVANVD